MRRRDFVLAFANGFPVYSKPNSFVKSDINLALLDEPFRGLDKDTRQQLMKTVRKKWEKITVICVIHDVSEALQFDQVAVLEEGRIVEQGSPEQLLKQNGALVRLLNHERTVANQWLDNSNWRRVSVKQGRIVEGNNHDHE